MKLSNNCYLEHRKWIALDGCKNGWICCQITKKSIDFFLIHTVLDLQFKNVKNIYLDMPVILPNNVDTYPRNCDIRAKKYLGRFHSSIFYAPVNSWLNLELNDINTICEKENKQKLSIQSYNLFSKLKEVKVAQSKIRSSFHEVHPELLFHYFLKDQKLSKKTDQGIIQRLDLISKIINKKIILQDIIDLSKKLKDRYKTYPFNKDDIIDVFFIASLIYQNSLASNDVNDRIKNNEFNKLFRLFETL